MIPDFYKGKQILASDFTALANEVKSNRITSVIGGTFQRGIHGTTIIVPQRNSQSAGGSSSESIEYPFKVGIYETEEFEGIGINDDSFLLKDATGDTITISNLGNVLPTPSLGNQIILEVTVGQSLIAESAIFKVGTWQALWPTYTNPVFRNPNTLAQEKLIIGIAECSSVDDTRNGLLYPAEEPEIKIVNLVKTDLCCFLSQLRGLPCLLAMPWHRHNQIQ